jgi:nucleoside-diphosphate-sugar epimerase
VLLRQLLAAGYAVRVLDNLRSGGESLIELVGCPDFEFIRGDIRDEETVHRACSDCLAVVHLAAIVGDPASRKEPELTRSVNVEGSHLLWKAATSTQCERFLFASTCSNYGKMANPDAYVNEDSPLQPLSLYSETKVEFERFLLGLPRNVSCKPTCLRFSTVYGLSPRIRFDLTVNEFTRELALGKELVIFGEQFWRPYCHVSDLARSVLAVLEADAEKVEFDVFNVGETGENYTKKMIVEEIQKTVRGGTVRYISKEEDPRDYRVSFQKIKDRLNFRISKRVVDGIAEISSVLASGLLQNPYDPKYSNV